MPKAVRKSRDGIDGTPKTNICRQRFFFLGSARDRQKIETRMIMTGAVPDDGRSR